MMIVAATAVIALIVVVVGLASLTPKSKPQSVNELPVAMFTYDANNLTVMFDATASSDPDGSIANYSWTFGDASEGNGTIVTHVYANDGTFRVNLTVTDNGGGKNSSSKDLTVKMTVSPAKKYPVAVIQVEKDGLRVNVSGAKSEADDDATITSYAWTFGDGESATGVDATHTYAANGTYTINLTVTDSNGLTDSTTVSVTVASPPAPPPPAKKYPVAVIQVEKDGLRVNVSGAKSQADNDATITSYAWTFGDGGDAAGVSATHTYAANGTYTISLTVTDSNGLTNSTTVSVTVSSLPTPPPPPPSQNGPPGLLHAIEIHKEKANRNSGLQNSLDHLQENLQKWLDSHADAQVI
jgi:PKD repeat protein